MSKNKTPAIEAEKETTLEEALGLPEATEENETEQLSLELPAEPEAVEAAEPVEPEAEVEAEPEVVLSETPGDLVLDDYGVPLFKRMAPVYADPGITQKVRTPASYKARDKKEAVDHAANASALTFPTDRFGITKDVKKALIVAASRIAGDDRKLELVQEVLAIMSKHIVAKHKADKRYRQRLAERAAKE